MTQDVQSIEDLISSSRGGEVSEDSVEGKFQKKQYDIQIKDMERQTKARAVSLGFSYIDLAGFPISPEALSLIPEERARVLEMICFYYDGAGIRIGIIDPENNAAEEVINKLTQKYHAEVQVYLISKHSIEHVFNLYKSIPKIRIVSRGVEVTQEDLDKFSENFTSFKDLQTEIDKAQISDIVAMIMASAIKSGASDIHIEAEEKVIKVRFRVDGVLHDAADVSSDLWKKIISRMKVLAKVKINVTDKPQDGRLSIITRDERIDIRASFLPTNFGESVVMRLLRSSTVGLNFEDLGIRDKSFQQLKREVERPNGMIITTGPTGSGKTTTLYAILKKLNDSETKIITVEDPIEYQLEGINQSQTSDKYTFAQGLRSIVRQDPDVVMIGEIRDLETAEIAIQAALTGHLVLSTIHTNDAAGTVPRFMSMGAKPYLLAPALNAMIGQRLVRRVCSHCKAVTELTPDEKIRVVEVLNGLPDDEKERIKFTPELTGMNFYKGQGCEACQKIGYKGRIGIYEIMVMNEEIEKLVLTGSVSEYDMRAVAKKYGMISMVQDGLLKAIDGITSVDEVFRVAE